LEQYFREQSLAFARFGSAAGLKNKISLYMRKKITSGDNVSDSDIDEEFE
jgi:hypothetical protein